MTTVKSCVVLVLVLAGTTEGFYDKRGAGAGMKDCPKDKYQHHVVLTGKSDKKGLAHCGGSLLSDKWVITAAHCYEKGLEVVLGRHSDMAEERRKVLKVYKCDVKTGNTPHDLMLLEIEHENRNSFPTIELPSLEGDCQSPFNEMGVFVSYMHAKVDSKNFKARPASHTPNLRCGELDVKPCSCTYKQGFSHIYLGKYLLCGDGQNTNCDSCGGASGGSLMKKNTPSNQNSKLYGVLVLSGPELCVRPVRFMDLCNKEYRDWIARAMAGQVQETKEDNSNRGSLLALLCCGKQPVD